MIKRIKFTQEAFEKYLDNLNDKFGTSILWNTLQGKSEYGSGKSEKGYQKIASAKASGAAMKLGLNEERTAFYTKCLGAAFPAFGKGGKKLIEEYAFDNDLYFDEIETMASVVEESFSQSGKFVVEGLREILLELFDASKDSTVKEIELAKLYHEYAEILKIFDSVSRDKFFEGEKFLDNLIETKIAEAGIIGCKKELATYKNSLEIKPKEMTAEGKENYFKCIDQYKEYSGDECLINFILYANDPA